MMPTIEDPLRGKIAGKEALTSFFRSFHPWLREHQAHSERVATIQGQEEGKHREVIESLLSLNLGEKAIKLPIATVGEHDKTTGKLVNVRIYHSTWLLYQSHRIRPPLLPENPNIHLPPAVARYQSALAKGDLSAMIDAFDAENAYVREPSGGDYVFARRDGLEKFYGFLFSFGGGAELEHCCVTQDGVNCAIEYNIVRLGRFVVEKQAGIAVYQQGDTGRLVAARIYDDFEPPSI